MLHRFFLLALTALLAACAQLAPPSAAAPRYLLLGEVHDNAEGHRLRVAELEKRLAAGWRPALALEQFDLAQQPQLTAAQTRCGSDAQCIVDTAAGNARWDWPLYLPLLELAQRYQLPLLAANLSRADAGKIVRGGFAAALDERIIARYQLDALPVDVLAGQIDAVRLGHCNQLPEALLPGMARAQIARDVMMAETLQNAGHDAVLIAGNGHVRRDIGAGRWLPAGQVETMAWLENAQPPGIVDRQILIAASPRDEPCAGVPAAAAAAK